MNFFDELSFSYLEYKINNSYTNRLMKYGNSPQGLFWKNSFTQIHRFELIVTALSKYYDLKDFSVLPEIEILRKEDLNKMKIVLNKLVQKELDRESL